MTTIRRKRRNPYVMTRDIELIKTLLDNPRLTYEELGDMFKITRARVWQILTQNNLGDFKRSQIEQRKRIHSQYQVINSYYNKYFTPVRKFWSNVNIGELDECWNWKGYVAPTGHGKAHLFGALEYSHRIAYFLAYNEGKIEKVSIGHTCYNKLCCNPLHTIKISGRARLDENTVKHIKYMLKDGNKSMVWIARKFNVGYPTVAGIKYGSNWKNIKIVG